MNALTYFFFNLGLLNILLALTAFLLGLLLGWLLWGKFKSQISSYISRQKKDQSEIDSLKSKNQSVSAKLANAGVVAGAAAVAGRASAKAGGNSSLQAEYDQCKSRRIKLEADQKNDHKLISDLRSKLAECEKDNSANNGGASDEDLAAAKEELAASKDALASCNRKCEGLEEERTELKSKLASQSLSASAATIPVAAAAASIPSVDARPAVSSAPAAGGNSASRDFFKEDLASGKMVEDDKYGLLYNSAPNEVDDLTKIKGVAGVLNKTLNDYGVFTYRQIAIWNPQICEDFSERISFKGRIERDDWISQCKSFHKEKYGETI